MSYFVNHICCCHFFCCRRKAGPLKMEERSIFNTKIQLDFLTATVSEGDFCAIKYFSWICTFVTENTDEDVFYWYLLTNLLFNMGKCRCVENDIYIILFHSLNLAHCAPSIMSIFIAEYLQHISFHFPHFRLSFQPNKYQVLLQCVSVDGQLTNF